MDAFKLGLSEIARRMQTDPKFSEITQVSAWSKLVYERGELLRLMGFELGERDDKKKEALATMTREKFIEKYGNTP